ncbi:OLC1v1038675C1 [Oldenlandia corymbosa var. corymbosa]|uniref:OLC1v1038675C1 n=1 Tax=Oldenlandia corymbosa var. corymbosa TaxID=529605 RepID=A0AAV1D0I9_OLDCO|nr:OLC1v1038675C1 [Oldenlandia corymbosa var. corymbosa]
MAHSVEQNGSESMGMEHGDKLDEETARKWADIDRLPTQKRLRSSLFDEFDGNKANGKKKQVVDVTKLGALERHMFIEKLIKHIEYDNRQLLQKIRKRIDKVGIELPSVEVRYNDLLIEAECEVVSGKALPTLWNSFKSLLLDLTRFTGLMSQVSRISIIDGVSGIIKPGRMTLLLGPPGCGKTTLLKALSGNLSKSLEVSGGITYNGYKLTEFVPQKTSAYISQDDLHTAEMTVRETLDFSLRCQGVGSRADILTELIRREKEAGIVPDPDVDSYMKGSSIEGQKTTLQTDYILRILGLDTCADTLVGDAMRRGISGGEKKRLTTGEMIVGPTRALFMDEISNGLDSSTTYQIVTFLQQLAHLTDATILVSLLQPAPETFDLFDDIILMGDGKIVYHGPRTQVLEFFESCGFRCPERKGVADFLQEVMSRKDQAQYWHGSEDTYSYVPIDALSRRFRESSYGKMLSEQLSSPFETSKSHKDAISFTTYSLPKWELFKACLSRELLLMNRNSFIYVFKFVQISINASITMTLFLRTKMKVDLLHANYYMGALFYAISILVINGFPELSLTVARLGVFYKQRDLSFYPGWAYAIPSAILKIPLSLLEAVVFTCLTYYVIGYTPEVGRFFGHLAILFVVHMASVSMYRFIASVCRTVIAATMGGSLVLLYAFVFVGFIIPRSAMPNWLQWGFWACPFSYGEIAVTVNEFLAPRWKKMLPSNTTTIGRETLDARGLDFNENMFWISLGALLAFTLLFNMGFTLALNLLHPVRPRAIISRDKFSLLNKGIELEEHADTKLRTSSLSPGTFFEHLFLCYSEGNMVLPFEPLTVVFQDLQYYVDTPVAMKDHGVTQKKLQLLHDITGTFRPGVLTALMGVSGAGKTTLFDVIAGRKTSGTVEGEIKIGGFPKVQNTFARISGYCEQTDIHSPQITVEESVIFSAWLRLHPDIDSKTRSEFVEEVLETIELDGIKDALVGIPGVTGLSTEQRKRLTIAVELVANPSIIFLDEPTTGLDARAAAIVMRAVKNVAATGRTIVCTIHQPSIDIFEAFDELLLLKTGGRMIYCGPLGQHSSEVIKYFQGITGVRKIRKNYNPATWMLEITSTSSEADLRVDFADIYRNSSLYENNKALVERLSSPPDGAKPLEFPSQFAQDGWGQFKACLWKQHLSYWRSPSYNLMRYAFLIITSLVLGVLFWKKGQEIENQQNLFNILGAMFTAALFLGFNNSSSVLPYVSTERSVLYREKFAGMYSPWAYALAQVAIEIPYIFVQVVIFSVITYPMIGFYGSAYKVFWYMYSMFCTLLYYNYLGMMMIAMTPSFPVAAILLSTFYNVFNLFAGFLIPQPQIPKWWIWLYYLNPTSWTMNALFTSQYGDIQKPLLAFGKKSTVAEFMGDYFDFHHHKLPIVAVMLIVYPTVFASLFLFFISKLNFQKR